MICNISIHFCRILTYFNNNTIIIPTIIINIIIIMSSIIATITTVSIIAIKGVSINIIVVSWLLIINPKQ